MLLGLMEIAGSEYYVGVKKLVRESIYYLISKVAKSDFSNQMKGLPLASPEISSLENLKNLYTDDYLLEELVISNFKQSTKKYGNVKTLELMLTKMAEIEAYCTKQASTVVNKEEVNGEVVEETSFADAKYSKHVIKKSNKTTLLEISAADFKLKLSNVSILLSPKVQLQELVVNDVSLLKGLTIENITFDRLKQSLDMSWYKDENGVCKKDYTSVKTNKDFEEKVMIPLVDYIESEHKAGRMVDVGLDTETTGLQICALSDNNINKSHCVSAQLSWKDDQGVAIFYDMKYFTNCDGAYVSKRLTELFQHREEFDITVGIRTVHLNRNWYRLVGHNVMFDRKTMYGEGADVWFDEDSLQIAFNLNTKTVRGNNKLKVLTRNFFGHETPELTDILGKGNEDKFKYLQDEEVVCIYGCADPDYTRQVYHKLLTLATPYMIKRYEAQDVKLLNVLAISEYYGMNTLEDKVKALTQDVYNDLQVLKELMYSYVGAHCELIELKSKLDILLTTGNITKEEYAKELLEFTPSPNSRFYFEVKPAEIQHVMYDILKYPILARTETGEPKVDKYVIKKLLRSYRTESSTARKLKHDVLHSGCDRVEYERLKNGSEKDKEKAKKMVFIDVDTFNKYEYPFAYIYQFYSSLNKEYTSYLKPTLEKNLEGKMFYNYNMARIETRRISNPGQTMKGSLKKLIKPYSDDYYLLDFDMSQAEYRVMVSLANYTEMINKMKDPENDYHTETAAVVNSLPAHKVTKKIRKQVKSISFGIPYGLGESSLCENMYGEINDNNLFATRMLMNKWQENNAPVMNLLNEARDVALQEWKISDDLRDYIQMWEREYQENKKGKLVPVVDEIGRPVYKLDDQGKKIPIPISKAENVFGFYRTFNLSKIDLSEAAVARRKTGRYNGAESTIRRAAGNYGIQSFAAELFRIILMRFYDACEASGYHHGDKIIWHELIHDELLCSVHKSIHPFEIFKLVKNACMLTMPNHTNYFVGINMGDTWGECKDDAREAPVHFVNRIVKRWDAGEFTLENTPAEFKKVDENGNEMFWFNHPFDFILPYMEEYKTERIGEVVKEIQPNVDNEPMDVRLLLDNFSNYTVRAYVNDYPENFKVDKSKFKLGERDGVTYYDDDKFDDAKWESRLASWAIKYFGEGKEIKSCMGYTYKVESKLEPSNEFTKASVEDLFIDEDEGQKEIEEWFDDDGILDAVFFEEKDKEVTLEVKDVPVNKFKHIHLYNGQLVINVRNAKEEEAVKKQLFLYRASSGYLIKFRRGSTLDRWITIRSIDLSKLDSEIDQVLQ